MENFWGTATIQNTFENQQMVDEVILPVLPAIFFTYWPVGLPPTLASSGLFFRGEKISGLSQVFLSVKWFMWIKSNFFFSQIPWEGRVVEKKTHLPFYILIFSKAFFFHSLQACFSSKLSSQRSFLFSLSVQDYCPSFLLVFWVTWTQLLLYTE